MKIKCLTAKFVQKKNFFKVKKERKKERSEQTESPKQLRTKYPSMKYKGLSNLPRRVHPTSSEWARRPNSHHVCNTAEWRREDTPTKQWAVLGNQGRRSPWAQVHHCHTAKGSSRERRRFQTVMYLIRWPQSGRQNWQNRKREWPLSQGWTLNTFQHLRRQPPLKPGARKAWTQQHPDLGTQTAQPLMLTQGPPSARTRELNTHRPAEQVYKTWKDPFLTHDVGWGETSRIWEWRNEFLSTRVREEIERRLKIFKIENDKMLHSKLGNPSKVVFREKSIYFKKAS